MSDNKPQPPIQQLTDFQLENIEKAVYSQKRELAALLILQALKLLRTGSHPDGHSREEALRPKLYSRLTAAITALIADPAFLVNDDGYNLFCMEHAMLCALYESSVYDNSDHLARLLADNPEEKDANKLKMSGQALPKWLMIRTMNSYIELDYDKLYAGAAKTMLASWLGHLSHQAVLHPVSHERREKVLGMHHYFEKCELHPGMLPALSDVYMYCSYAVRPDRHDVKIVLNSLMRKLMKKYKLAEGPRLRSVPLKERPTVLVMVEWMHSMHAMYRCYAPSILQLHEKFNVVGMGAAHRIDEKGKALFTAFHDIKEEETQLDKVFATIREINPDIIYYPSVGMNPWIVPCSAWRLAPIQVMTLGHPASTYSPEMDYVIAEEGQTVDVTLHSERIVNLPKNAIQFVWRDDAQEPEDIVAAPKPEGTIRIAIPGMVCKVTVPFLEMLRRVQQRVKERKPELKVVFCFFPSVLGLVQYQIHKELKRWLGDNFIVYARLAYKEYMQLMKACDLQLSTFPFGGTNTNIDAFMLGNPVVCLDGVQPYERFDTLMLERVLLGAYACQSIAEYEDAVVELILSPYDREVLRKRLRELDIKKEFFGPREGPAKGAFVKAMWHLYQNHDTLKSTSTPIHWKEYITDEA